MNYYINVVCNECEQEVCQTCGCCYNVSCARCSCPTINKKEEMVTIFGEI